MGARSSGEACAARECGDHGALEIGAQVGAVGASGTRWCTMVDGGTSGGGTRWCTKVYGGTRWQDEMGYLYIYIYTVGSPGEV